MLKPQAESFHRVNEFSCSYQAGCRLTPITGLTTSTPDKSPICSPVHTGFEGSSFHPHLFQASSVTCCRDRVFDNANATEPSKRVASRNQCSLAPGSPLPKAHPSDTPGHLIFPPLVAFPGHPVPSQPHVNPGWSTMRQSKDLAVPGHRPPGVVSVRDILDGKCTKGAFVNTIGLVIDTQAPRATRGAGEA